MGFPSNNGQSFNHDQGIPTRGPDNVKQVFTVDMTAHVWAQQTQARGRNQKGTFFFRDRTIYSYSTTWPVATFLERETIDGKRIVVFNDDTYSITTTTHGHAARSALHGLDVLIVVADRKTVQTLASGYHDKGVEALLKYEVGKLEETARRYLNFKDAVYIESDPFSSVDDALNRTAALNNLHFQFKELAHQLGVSLTERPDFDAAAASKAIHEAYKNWTAPEAVEKRERAAGMRSLKWLEKGATFEKWGQYTRHVEAAFKVDVEKAIKHLRAYQIHRAIVEIDSNFRFYNPNARGGFCPAPKDITPDQWHDGAKGHVNPFMTIEGRPGSLERPMLGTLVRRATLPVEGDCLETSRGAICPWRHAVVAFLQAQKCRKLGQGWATNGHTIKVGHFKVDSIDVEGNLWAGCHTLAWEEMLRLAIREVPAIVEKPYPVPMVISKWATGRGTGVGWIWDETERRFTNESPRVIR